MPFNLLLFPLVGGYYFLIRSNLFRYIQQRQERQKLLFNSVLAGLILLVCSFTLTLICFYLFPWFEEVKAFFPIHLPFFGTALFSLILGVFFAEAGNKFIDEGKAISKAIKRIGNEFELLLEDSIKNEFLIQITLKNDKFYIGWVKALPIPQQSNYIVLLPAFSGYRNSETKKMVFTTQYLDVYATYVEQGLVTDIKNLTRLVLKVDEVLSANEFDMDMYERFNNSPIKQERYSQ